MKKLFLFLPFALISSCLPAQTFEHALSFGYNTTPASLCQLADGRYLVTGRGETAPGEIFTDSLFAVIFNASGQIENRFILAYPPGEVRFVNDVLPVPDGGFVVSIAATECDVAGNGSALLGYDPAGTLRWSLWAQPFSFDYLPSRLELTPDGQVLGVQGNLLTAFNYLTGEVLWEAQLPGQSQIYDLDFIPGSWDFAAVGLPNLQIWRQFGPPDQHNYYQDFGENQPSFAFFHQVLATNDGIYALDSYNQQIIRYDEATQNPVYEAPVGFDFHSLAKVDSLFWISAEKDNRFWLLNISGNGQMLGSHSFGDDWRWGSLATVSGDTAVLAGVSGSGPGSNLGGGPYAYDATHLWLEKRSFDIPVMLPENAGLTAVEQIDPVHVITDSVFAPPVFTVYNLSGGNFQVQVTNFGADTLRSIDVLIHFSWNEYYDICYMKPSVRRHFDHFSLPPGEAAWFDFGDVAALGQANFPIQYCFWTAAPNGRPDADHSDDAFCHTISTETGGAAAGGPLRIFPNPAPFGEFVVEWPAELTETVDYQIFDTYGRMVERGQAGAGTAFTQVSTRGWTPGFYFFQAGKWRGKLVIGP